MDSLIIYTSVIILVESVHLFQVFWDSPLWVKGRYCTMGHWIMTKKIKLVLY